MKRAALIFFLALLFALPSKATWSMVQHPNTGSSCASATTCTITLTQNTGSGNLLVIALGVFGPNLQPTISSISAGGTFVTAANCRQFLNTLSGVDCGYVLSSTSGVGSITVTYTNGNSGSGDVCISVTEYHSTLGPGVYDTSNSTTHAATTNPVGVALTLSGSNDVIFQFASFNAAGSAISGSYTNPADFPVSGFYGFAGWINTSSGAAPTWTAALGSSSLGAMAFKETGATTAPTQVSPFLVPN